MFAEIDAAVGVLVDHLKLYCYDAALENWRASVTEVLRKRFRQHWHPSDPLRGSGYRALMVGSSSEHDPVLMTAAEKVGLDLASVKLDLTVWCDPCLVSWRVGDDGPIHKQDIESAKKRREKRRRSPRVQRRKMAAARARRGQAQAYHHPTGMHLVTSTRRSPPTARRHIQLCAKDTRSHPTEQLYYFVPGQVTMPA